MLGCFSVGIIKYSDQKQLREGLFQFPFLLCGFIICSVTISPCMYPLLGHGPVSVWIWGCYVLCCSECPLAWFEGIDVHSVGDTVEEERFVS